MKGVGYEFAPGMSEVKVEGDVALGINQIVDVAADALPATAQAAATYSSPVQSGHHGYLRVPPLVVVGLPRRAPGGAQTSDQASPLRRRSGSRICLHYQASLARPRVKGRVVTTF